ncbi:MAG: hypothetical protein U0903_01575 [Planctomycetales bacterium]
MKNFLVAGGLGLALMFSGVCNAAVTTGHRIHPMNHSAANRSGLKLAAAHRTNMRRVTRGAKTTPFHHTHTGQHVTHHNTTPTTATNIKTTPPSKPTATPSTPANK